MGLLSLALLALQQRRHPLLLLLLLRPLLAHPWSLQRACWHPTAAPAAAAAAAVWVWRSR
jgi:hypothetical protein